MSEKPDENRQAGVPLGDMGEEPPRVAHGDRRAEAHYEPDADQLAKVRFTAKPESPVAPELGVDADVAENRADKPPVEDVAVSLSDASVWDARPQSDPVAEDGESPGR